MGSVEDAPFSVRGKRGLLSATCYQVSAFVQVCGAVRFCPSKEGASVAARSARGEQLTKGNVPARKLDCKSAVRLMEHCK